MSLSSIEKLLRKVSSFRANADSSSGDDMLSFTWHGGEPFLVPLRYFDEVGSLQRNILRDEATYKNCVQTNLTILTDEHVRSLKERRFFQELGFSFDVYGDQRTPGKFMRSHFPGSRSDLTYDRVARKFFALSTRRDGIILT